MGQGVCKINALGLDVSSSSTGWVLLKKGRFYKREGIDYGWIKPKKGPLHEKLNYFRLQLECVMEKVHADVVGIEDVFLSRNVNTLKVLSRFSGVAVETVYSFLEKNPPYIVQVKEARAQWGTQDKEEVFNIIKNKYKLNEWTFKKHNDITDALSIARYVSGIMGSK